MFLQGLLIGISVIQCLYALYFFTRVFQLSGGDPNSNENLPPVSVIICAKNEAGNLAKNLPAILNQRYHNKDSKPLYEVIVVNDASDDDTAAVLRELERRYDNLWDVIISGDETRVLKGKKHALSKGAAAAKHDILLLTDADCAPNSDQWLRMMTAPLTAGKEIVAGYGGYHAGGSPLNAFIRWETLHTFLQYSAYARAGKPYMAVGRNLACARKALMKAQENKLWNTLPSGDDDMLIRIAGNRGNTAIVADKRAFTYTTAKGALKEWIAQKQRHLSTGKYYKMDIKMLLGAYGVSHAAGWLVFFLLLATGYAGTAMIWWGVRCGIYWALWAVTAGKLEEKKLIYLFPLFDIGWMIYNFAFLPYITWKNKQQWT